VANSLPLDARPGLKLVAERLGASARAPNSSRPRAQARGLKPARALSQFLACLLKKQQHKVVFLHALLAGLAPQDMQGMQERLLEEFAGLGSFPVRHGAALWTDNFLYAD
jgi:hypothetical protein